MRLMLILVSLLSFSSVKAQELPLYYGADFLKSYQDKSLTNESLKSSLFTILSGGHLKTANAPDKIISGCATGQSQCQQHHALGYDGARKKLFGLLFLRQSSSGAYSVKDVYCERELTDEDFGGKNNVGPDKYPTSGNVMNTEHTWPQSKFSTRFLKDMQKSDLHHLFPTDSEMNNHRANLHFGNVISIKNEQKCRGNKLGTQADGEMVFEVPDSQKGNSARAIFYFATRLIKILKINF